MTVAVILAGGLGTRLRAAVPDLPKPMAPINGRPFLEHQMDYWLGQGVSRFVLSVGYRNESITEHFGGAYRGAPVDYAVETAPLGTGGGLLLAVSRVKEGCDGSVLVLNGDTFFEVDLAALRSFHQQRGADWTMALFRTQERGRYMGLDLAPDGRVPSLRLNADLAPKAGAEGRLANGGVYLVRIDALASAGFAPGAKASLEDEILPRIHAARERVFGLEAPGRFIDIGVPDDYRRAGEILPK